MSEKDGGAGKSGRKTSAPGHSLTRSSAAEYLTFVAAAGQGGVRRLLLFGNQGKLIKLAGGIFHTHHHLADGRLEILTAHAALEGLGGEALRRLHEAATVETALSALERHDAALAERVRRRLSSAIETRCRDYLQRHDAAGPAVGAVLFDRGRRIRACGPVGEGLLRDLVAAGTGAQPTPRVQGDTRWPLCRKRTPPEPHPRPAARAVTPRSSSSISARSIPN